MSIYRTYAKIDLDAIKANFLSLKARVKPGTLLCAVVKADAYGHGSVQVAKALENMADYFAVAALSEAVLLRENGISKPILVLSHVHEMEYPLLLRHNVTATIFDYEQAKHLSELAQGLGLTARVHIAVETGMGRIGVSDDEAGADVVEKITKLASVEVQGLFSHYAKADYESKDSAMRQTERFDRFIALLESRGIYIPIRHICNSAAIIDFDRHYDMVRMGISLYGMYPSDEVKKENVSLKPAMSVYTHVLHVKTVHKGDGIGYGHIYVADEDRRIATLGIGYADGYNRDITGKGYVLIKGRRAPIRGKVCMDQIMVDVTDIDGVEVGDEAVIMGESGRERISAELLGSWCHSFCYEVVCTFTPRVTRVYVEK